MRAIAVLCVLVVCTRYSSCVAPTNRECRSLPLPVFNDPNICINTTLVDCANVLVLVTIDFDGDNRTDWSSDEIQLTENVEVCYNIEDNDDNAPDCRVCAQFTDVDATGDGATFDPILKLSGGPLGICSTIGATTGGIKLDQVQVGSDCNDAKLKSSCFLSETCGWCESTRTCESVNTTDGSPHCADCASGWTLSIDNQPSNGGDGGSPANNWVSRDNSLAYGLGIGIPLVLGLGVCAFMIHRRNKKLGTGGAFDFERHSDETSRSDARGTRILMTDAADN